MQKKNVKNGLIVALLITVLFFIPSLALPADVGNIDGLWMSPASGSTVAMIRENGGLVLVTPLDLTDMSWLALYGPISGNSVQISVLVSQSVTAFAGDMTFTSDTSGVLVVTDCQPPEQCVFPLNVPIPFIKLF